MIRFTGLGKEKAYRDCEEALIKGVFSIAEEEFFAKFEAVRINPIGDNPIAKYLDESKQKICFEHNDVVVWE